MQNNIANPVHYHLLFFNTRFQENGTHYCLSTLKNAQYIFIYSQKIKKFENIIFDKDSELEKDLDFLNESALEMRKIVRGYSGLLLSQLSDHDRSETLKNFRNHSISNWQTDEIFFSCGTYCCMQQLKSPEKPATHFYYSIYQFLLNNTFSLQFYFFLKQNNILLQDRKKAIDILVGYLGRESGTIMWDRKNITKFLENFVLIWDLFEYNLSDYLTLKKQFTIDVESNQCFEIMSIQKYFQKEIYKRRFIKDKKLNLSEIPYNLYYHKMIVAGK